MRMIHGLALAALATGLCMSNGDPENGIDESTGAGGEPVDHAMTAQEVDGNDDGGNAAETGDSNESESGDAEQGDDDVSGDESDEG